MRIAAVYWPTSSVGGINTELRTLRDEALRRGHTFDVLRSGRHSRIEAGLFGERKLIRGGDTFVTIDGEASHHPDQLARTLDFLHRNYDRVYYSTLCPHPTKDYGDKPLFLGLMSDLWMPAVARITDGYWDDYREWGEAALAQVESATYTHRNAGHFWKTPKVWYVGPPFHGSPVRLVTARERFGPPLTVWTSQWKAIKGIHHLLPHLPAIKTPVELYSNGILYYQLRSTPAWKAAVGRDLFAPEFSGDGRADFFGYVAYDQIPLILQRATFCIDLMGLGRPKHKTYQAGAFNNTALEALWYGALPILSASTANVIPRELAAFVDDASQVPDVIASPSWLLAARSNERHRKAQVWVKANHGVEHTFDQIVLGEKEPAF